MTHPPLPRHARITPAPLHPATVALGGFKHATVGLIALAIALEQQVVLTNVPDIEDVKVLCELIRQGNGVAHWNHGTLTLDTRGFFLSDIPESSSRRVHGVLYFLPVLLGRFKRVRIGPSGGCPLDGSGSGPQRPVHHMLAVLERFGARFRQEGHEIQGETSGFTACTIDCMSFSERPDLLTGPLVSGVTKTAILAAACTRSGPTRIRNPYPKPDVTELLLLLDQAGFIVRREGRDLILIPPDTVPQPPPALHHHVVTCLSEVITFIALSQHCKVSLTLTGLTVKRLRQGLAAEIALLDAMGVGLDWGKDLLEVTPSPRLASQDIEVTSVGIYSDHQPFFALMLLDGDRPARISEAVWKTRFSYAHELSRLGACIHPTEGGITITPSSLTQGERTVVACDLRAAAVLVLAALTAPGTTTVQNVHHLDRGYANLLDVLAGMGARCDLDGSPQPTYPSPVPGTTRDPHIKWSPQP
ncbi:MAG: hypothetical protein HQL76_12310 [Magnetococcales bacterium]|nr:hypothetical protein [Magnetococcales bacterium]